MLLRFLLPLLSLPLLLLAACDANSTTAPTATSNQAAPPFFDLEAYIDSEIARLRADKQVRFQKSVRLNGQTETKQLTAIDLEKDLAIFRKAVINRPAWRDKYQVERSATSEVYTARDSSLLTQRIELRKDTKGQISQLLIDGKSGSVLTQEQKSLQYEPSKGYRISSQRRSELLGDTDVEIVVNFVGGE